jgi:hypothetical protein
MRSPSSASDRSGRSSSPTTRSRSGDRGQGPERHDRSQEVTQSARNPLGPLPSGSEGNLGAVGAGRESLYGRGVPLDQVASSGRTAVSGAGTRTPDAPSGQGVPRAVGAQERGGRAAWVAAVSAVGVSRVPAQVASPARCRRLGLAPAPASKSCQRHLPWLPPLRELSLETHGPRGRGACDPS